MIVGIYKFKTSMYVTHFPGLVCRSVSMEQRSNKYHVKGGIT